MLSMKKNKYNYTINLKLFGYHGVYDNEKNDGQNFYLNINYSILEEYVNTDTLNNDIDYSKVVDLIIKIFNSKRYNLLESLVFDVHKSLTNTFNFTNVNII